MEFKTYILFGIAVFLFLFAGTEKTSLTEGCRLGDLAPGIESEEKGRMIDFSNSECFSLVNFWAVYDAASRIRNIQLWNKMKELDSTRINLYSVSMDENKSVFEETLKMDKLGTKNQLFDKRGKKSPVYRKYGLKNGFRNFLIDKRGVIIAIDVSPDELSKIAGKTM
ncbi:MAG: thioredoxin family protein [Tannerella sp.]|jgi:hypothetical protein|nr:thioredoxin family protein [Tannerella sp.]